MIVYGTMFLVTIFFAVLVQKEENKVKKIILLIVTVIPAILVSGLRYGVGTDYFFRYVPNFISFVQGENVDSLEPLFRVLIRICILFSNDYVLFFIVTSILIIAMFMLNIFKNSKHLVISIIIFFCGSFFFESMNLLRQFIAMAILFVSYKLLFKRNKIPLWILSVLIATLFHTMSIVFLITILLDKKVLNYKVLIIASLVIILIGGVALDGALKLTENIDNTNIAKYARYIVQSGDLPWSGIIVELGVYIYLYLLYVNAKRNDKEIEKEGILLINMQTVTVLCTLMNMHIDLFFRVAILFSMFQMLSIPYFYVLNKDCEMKIFKNEKILNFIKLKVKKWNLIACILVIVLLSARMFYSNIIKGADEILPYKTIFEREGN